MKIGEFLRKKRVERRLTVRGFAEKAGVSAGYITLLGRGQCNPTLDTLNRLLKALGVDWLEFLEATGYRKPSKIPAKRTPRRRG